METDGRDHLYEEELSADAQAAATACQDFLRKATYRPQGDYEICMDGPALKHQASAFFAKFSPLVKNRGEIRLTALRFLKRASLPVKEGAIINLIPIIISESPSVSNKALQLGWYLHLTRDATVEPECYCLAVLSQ
ncbi:hypothetical protein LSUE1_G007485 [Lachnellula suecica]|uniref:Uncharacterized protein n=1 Tax=Lachnellula suecica TaxID=602035 RepID=A0A8T9CAU1_9HELO|nr:hypothetical protein LSUE1_G007485 [Lachnellula suecica]